jgi:hypothetical protein
MNEELTLRWSMEKDPVTGHVYVCPTWDALPTAWTGGPSAVDWDRLDLNAPVSVSSVGDSR